MYFPGSCWGCISWSKLWCMLAWALPSLPGGGQIQDRAASTDIAGSTGPVISRERPFLGSRRVNDSSTELGLPPHGNSLGLQNPSGYWESIAPAVPEISVPRKNLARSLPGFSPAFFPRRFLVLDLPSATPGPLPQAITGGGPITVEKGFYKGCCVFGL